jgi:hypothetical protein
MPLPGVFRDYCVRYLLNSLDPGLRRLPATRTAEDPGIEHDGIGLAAQREIGQPGGYPGPQGAAVMPHCSRNWGEGGTNQPSPAVAAISR